MLVNIFKMKEEIWKPYKDTRYDISNMGRVRSTNRPDNIGHIRSNQSGVLVQKTTINGYKQIQLNGTWKTVHRLVAEVFVPNNKVEDISELVVDHIDNNKQNNVATNLQWLTYSENTKKAFEDGLIPGMSEQHIEKNRQRFIRINELHKKRIHLYNKKDEKEYEFSSAKEASSYLGKYPGYFSEIITKNKGENRYWKAWYA